MKTVNSHYSYASCDDLKATLNAMFPGRIPESFTMGSTKVSYLITDATGPYFHDCLIEDVLASETPYTIQYDETTNSQDKKTIGHCNSLLVATSGHGNSSSLGNVHDGPCNRKRSGFQT